MRLNSPSCSEFTGDLHLGDDQLSQRHPSRHASRPLSTISGCEGASHLCAVADAIWFSALFWKNADASRLYDSPHMRCMHSMRLACFDRA